MTNFEKYFIEIHHYLNEIGLEHWLIGSSLLGSFREKRAIKGDREVNFGVMGDDLIEFRDKLQEVYQLIFTPSNFRSGGLYLVNKGYRGDIWDHPRGFTWLAPYFESCKNIKSVKKLCQTPISGNLFYWDEDTILPTKKHKFLGEEFEIPAKPHKYMNEYFGTDWRTPIPTWHWASAKNLINVEDLC